MDIPGFNPGSMNDEELLNRINQCRFNVSKVQHQPHLASNMLMILEALEAEYHERITTRRVQEEREKNPATEIEIGSIQDISPKE